MIITYEEVLEKMENKKLSLFDKLLLKDFEKCFTKAENDETKRLLLAIDCQNDFMEGGTMGIPGSLKDMERITRFLYNNMKYITEVICSLDIHSPKQIFHPYWWKDSLGVNLLPYTMITLDDVRKGKYIPIEKYRESTERYIEELQKRGKQLCIWPYHCLKGTKGAALEEGLAKMIYLHSVLRDVSPIFIEKGKNPLSEQYGFIYSAETKNQFEKRIDLINLNLSDYDEVYIVGEAASHCVLESVKQIVEMHAFGNEAKIIVLTDCMSSIPGYEEQTQNEFARLEKEYGIVLANSTDIDLSK